MHFVETFEELERMVHANQCVAFDPRNVDALKFLLDDDHLHSAQTDRTPCVLEGSRPIPPMPGMIMPIDDYEPVPEPSPGPVPPPPHPEPQRPESTPGLLGRLFGGLFGGT